MRDAPTFTGCHRDGPLVSLSAFPQRLKGSGWSRELITLYILVWVRPAQALSPTRPLVPFFSRLVVVVDDLIHHHLACLPAQSPRRFRKEAKRENQLFSQVESNQQLLRILSHHNDAAARIRHEVVRCGQSLAHTIPIHPIPSIILRRAPSHHLLTSSHTLFMLMPPWRAAPLTRYPLYLLACGD